jgi:hypothetical protein
MNGPQKRRSAGLHAGLPPQCALGQLARRATVPYVLLGLIAGLAMHACSVFSPPPIRPTVDVTGFWEGRAIGACLPRMGRCGMVQISLSMIQTESAVSGMYRCATGSIMCRNQNTNGRIAVGTMRGPGLSIRVMFEDVSSCIFNGTFTDVMGGGSFICMAGGGMVDRGFWRVQRTYGPEPPPA